MCQLTVSQLVILENLNQLHTNGKKLSVPIAHLMAAFPHKISNRIDFDLVKNTLEKFGYILNEDKNSTKFPYRQRVLFRKIAQHQKSTQDKAA